jgi:titin
MKIVVIAMLLSMLAITSAGPAAPTDLVATAVSPTQINLAWTDNSDNENGFNIVRCQGDPECFDFGQVGSVPPGVTTFEDTGLTPGILYRYLVQAFNTEGSAYSNAAQATTPQIAPAAPSALTAIARKHGYSGWVDLAWSDDSNNESSFVIERCAGSSCTDFARLATVGVNARTYQDSAVARRTEYRYRAYATNSEGDSNYSNLAAVTTR